jgi:FAD/FMN-containing dehydrogenase
MKSKTGIFGSRGSSGKNYHEFPIRGDKSFADLRIVLENRCRTIPQRWYAISGKIPRTQKGRLIIQFCDSSAPYGAIKYSLISSALASPHFINLHVLKSVFQTIIPHRSREAPFFLPAFLKYNCRRNNGQRPAINVAIGEARSVSREKDGETFQGVGVGLGALGVITKLTLDLQPTFAMRQYVYQDLSFKTVLLPAAGQSVGYICGSARK